MTFRHALLAGLLSSTLLGTSRAQDASTPAAASFQPPPGAFARFATAYEAIQARGVLATTQDELVWQFGVVAEDLIGRGGARWNQGEAAMLADIEKTLCEGRADCSQVHQDVEAIVQFARTRTTAMPHLDIPVNRLMVAVLDWVEAHPQPRPLFRKWPIR